MAQFLGLGKTKFNSSVCLIDDHFEDIELLLTERLIRKKNSGAWPFVALKSLLPRLEKNHLLIGENRDVHRPQVIEEIQNQLFPFYEHLQKNGLDFFLSQLNPAIKFVNHHECHAYAALAISPFLKSIVVVMDGAGSEINPDEYEECTIFLQNGVNLTPIFKRFVNFRKSHQYPEHTFGNRIGASYEKISEFIFNSPHSSGKVMGLAPFGEKILYENHFQFQEKQEWKKSFKGNSKQEWEKLDHTLFNQLAASVQNELETDYGSLLSHIKKEYPDYPNLILTGGCALNCTNNAKILSQKLFDKIFVPPFPGDESIGFGLAHYLKYEKNPGSWTPIPYDKQSAYFGKKDSVPSEIEIEKEFNSNEFIIKKCADSSIEAAALLKEGNIIAWFQGRSESGPRALGNRSILVRPDIKGLKEKLNQTIKFRENFRPYGCSVLHDKAHHYFDVAPGFDNPYMSFAIKVRPEFSDRLQEVSHVDGTSRMQTVRTGQNKKFYQLIKNFGELTGLYCLLNTSLNVMDEPILETILDAKRFLLSSPIDFLVIENFVIQKKSSLL